VGFEQLSGIQAKVLRQSILSAFSDTGSVNIFLGDALNKPPLEVFAGGANLEQQIFAMIKAAQAEGWTEELIAALQASRPNNIIIRNLPDAIRLAETSLLKIQATGLSLEKVVNGGGFADLRIWAEKMVGIGQALCRIEYPTGAGTGFGTGFLISKDCVLTNFHVVENHLNGKLDPAELACRFDYARDAEGIAEGRLVKLAPGKSWLLAYSSYDPSDISGVGEAAADNLDFAVLRLGEAASEHEVGGGARRGVVSIPKESNLPADNAPIFVVQHPKGSPMALSVGIMKGTTANGSRMRYDADTLPGSSGSGVFDQGLNLVALHHAGDPAAALRAKYNQGIPIKAILAMLTAKEVATQIW
jgi:hypothetical protein